MKDYIEYWAGIGFRNTAMLFRKADGGYYSKGARLSWTMNRGTQICSS